MKKLLTILTAASLGGLALVARLGVAPPAAIAAGTCRGERVAAVVDPSVFATGSAVAAADGNALTLLRGGLVDRVSAPDHITGVLRHVSVTAGVGTTYVRDRDGDDVVVTETPRGVRRFLAGGEALNPSFSSAGDLVWAQRGGLRLVAAGSDVVRTIEGPTHHGIAFSPVFRDDGTMVVGIVSPSAGAAPEDESLSNLWRYDAVSDGWRRLTDFSSRRGSVDGRPHTVPCPGRLGRVRAGARARVAGSGSGVRALAAPRQVGDHASIPVG